MPGESGVVQTKKKRVTKKQTVTVLGSVDENALAAIGINIQDKSQPQVKDTKHIANKLSNHFTFGNQTGTADGQMNKTSNNKLDQSMRISYSEMAEVLKSFKPSFTSSIEQMNKQFEDEFFPEWFQLMK